MTGAGAGDRPAAPLGEPSEDVGDDAYAPLLVDLRGSPLDAEDRELLARPGVVGVCLFGRNLTSIAQGRELVAAVHQAAGRPLLIAIDQEGGGVVRLPQATVPPSAMALGAADDPQLSQALAAATGRGLRRIGVNLDFAPVADVQSNPSNPVIGDRAFGAEPALVGRHVAAFVRGLQASGVAATLKHFPGHGDVSQDSHLTLPRLDAAPERLAALEWPPFAAGIDAGAAAVMSAHVLVTALDPERPATLSRASIEGVLRERLGFAGVVISDALDMRAIADGWGVAAAAVLALAAGVDLPIVCNRGPAAHHAVLDALEAAVRDGRLDPARGYRDGFRLAAAAGVPAVHVALWNPAHVRSLPGPALVSFGFRPASTAAIADALLSGAAPGTPPVPLTPWSAS
jgi:beta-N-acetylhexosaminidase